MKRKYEEIEKEENQQEIEPMEIDEQEEEYYTIEKFIKDYIEKIRKKKLKNKKN